MAEIKQLPNNGTQKAQRDLVFSIVSAAWIMSLIALKFDWFTLEELQIFGVTFNDWWIAVGVTGGIYVVGEIGRKNADAQMNK